MKLILQGVDPGIVDTGLVTLEFDFERKRLSATGRVWSGVATRRGNSLEVSHAFLGAIKDSVIKDGFFFIEGFRNRGRDTYQDQTMTNLVQEIRRATGGVVVDNTGVKKVVTQDLLKLMQINRWPRTNHADLLSAARIALKGAIEILELNRLISSFVVEHHTEDSWLVTTTLIDQ